MREKLIFYSAFSLLLTAGAWGLWLIGLTPNTATNDTTETISSGKHAVTKVQTAKKFRSKKNESPNNTNLLVTEIQQLIDSGKSRAASDKINAHYSALSSDELSQIKSSYLSRLRQHLQADQYQQAQTLLINATTALDDLELWNSLGIISVRLNDWPRALTAQLKSADLEIDPQQLEITLLSLVKTARQLRAEYEQIDDQLSVRDLYLRLHSTHSGYSRFQLELAQAYLRLDNPELATPLLEQLQYDAEFGQLAQQKLALLKQNQQRTEEEVATLQPQNTRRSDILIPLKRIGNSFLVEPSINGRASPLLLDTGASITSLSSDLIQRLNLEPTGRSIQLSTANGVTRSNLYRARKIKLGRLTVNNLIVAEIDLRGSSNFQGLLGTDLLNQVNGDYSYLIDNQKNALIFRRR